MRGNRWGQGGPPTETYSRFTELERFEPLHPFALGILDQLEAQFDVERQEGVGLDVELEQGQLARSSVRLTPRSEGPAPVVIAFTTFPGLRMRLGWWCVELFPICGCDACDETAESESRRLAWLVEQAAAGRFRESVRLPRVGEGWQAHDFWGPGGFGRSHGGHRISRAEAINRMRESKGPSKEWSPWIRK